VGEIREFAPIPVATEAIAKNVVDAGFKVHSALGPGLLESSYEHCLAYEIESRGHLVKRQRGLPLIYREIKLEAAYRIDLLVDDAVIVEVKSLDALAQVHEAQVLTYLKLSGCRLGFLMNFNVPAFKQGLRRLVR
jgi:GxxExxY protein